LLLSFSTFSDVGFEEGIRDIRAGGKRRIIIPPDMHIISLFGIVKNQH